MDLTDIAMYCKIKQSVREADKYKQQSDLYESVLTGTVTEFVVPSEWTEIRRGAFNACTKLTSVTLSDNIATIGVTEFNFCLSLESINIPDGVIEIRDNAFYGCTSLIDMTISNTVAKYGLDLSPSTKYSVDTLVAMLTALVDRTGQTAYTLTLGATNLAKLILAKTLLQALLLPSAIESSLLAIVQCSIATRIGYAIICIKTS